MTDTMTQQRTAQRRGHVYEADVVRVLTFACVIAVHTISHTEPAGSVSANGFEMLLHFTREAFFALTGFVLLHQSLGCPAPLPARTFWRRRIVVVGVPYLAWSVIYTGIQSTAGFGSWTWQLRHLASNIADGTAWYHLYFLLVSMQIYLLWPLIDRLVRATARHHIVLLATSAAVQLVILTAQMYDPPQHGWLADVADHQDALIISYQFYVLLGAVAAFHLEAVRAFIGGHSRGVLVTIAATAVGAEAWYLVATGTGTSPLQASNVLQPVTLVWSIAALAGLFLLGQRYAERRVSGRGLDRTLSVASDRSFGVFLVHPLVLWLLLKGQARWLPGLHGVVLTVLAYLLVVAGSLAATELFRRSPASLPLTGRRVLRPVRSAEVPEIPAVPAAHHGPYREELHHAIDDADTPRARDKAPSHGHDDGDRHRDADSLLL